MLGNLDEAKAKRLYLDGTALALKRQFPKAIDALTRAIELKPDYSEAYLHRGIAYIDSGDSRQAISDISTALQGMPDSALAYYNRSIAYMDLNDSDAALTDMDSAIQFAPKDSNNYNHRCIIHSFRKEYDAANQDATQAIAFGAGKSGYNNRAIVEEKKGDYQAAINDWDKVLDLEPKNSVAFCIRGRVLAKLGEKDKALSDLKKGLKDGKLGPKIKKESEELLQKLETMR